MNPNEKTINISFSFSELYPLFDGIYSCSEDLKYFKKELRDKFISKMDVDDKEQFEKYVTSIRDNKRLLICPNCGEWFFSNRNKKYCSPGCQKKAKQKRYYDKHKKTDGYGKLKRSYESEYAERMRRFIDNHKCYYCPKYGLCDLQKCDFKGD